MAISFGHDHSPQSHLERIKLEEFGELRCGNQSRMHRMTVFPPLCGRNTSENLIKAMDFSPEKHPQYSLYRILCSVSVGPREA
jgi:hypothetical protein